MLNNKSNNSVTDIIKTFNSILESFLSQLSGIVGTTYYTYYKKIIKINYTIAIENAIIFMLPLREKIFNKDESYFSNDNLYLEKVNTDPIISIAAKKNNVNNDFMMHEIFRLKDIYYNFDEKSKENVWQILQAFVQLSLEYCEIKGIKI